MAELVPPNSLLDQWNDLEPDNVLDHEQVKQIFQERNELVKKIEEKRKKDPYFFPEAEETSFEKMGAVYPLLDDPKFVEKLMKKREFAESKQPSILEQIRKNANPCASEFELTPVQRFISRFINPSTPYNSALLYHGVGVGKTCAAVTIAEAFLEKYPRDQVIVVAPPNIQQGFETTIFDISNVHIGSGLGASMEEYDSEPNTHIGCTGNTYLKLTGTMFEQDPKVIQNRVKSLIKRRYDIKGYLKFANDIRKIELEAPAGIKKSKKAEFVDNELRRLYNGKVIIIDEAHNLRDVKTDIDDVDEVNQTIEEGKAGKLLTPSLRRLLSVTEGTTLILLSGTPMYNSYAEIIFLLNLLLLNDKRTEDFLSKDVIFGPDANFRTEAEKKRFGEVASRYVSFMRGENPLTFPTRIVPIPKMIQGRPDIQLLDSWPHYAPDGQTEISDQDLEKIQNFLPQLPFVQCKFDEPTAKEFKDLTIKIAKQSIGVEATNSLVQAGNWLWPNKPGISFDKRIGEDGFNNTFAATNERGMLQYKCRGSPSFLAQDNLGSVSPKTKNFIQRVRGCQGCAFIYSRFVPAGALSIAIALEANGFTLYGRKNGFLFDGIQTPGGRQCARCPLKEEDHKRNTNINHSFLPAKYVLLTGDDDLTPNNRLSVQAQRRSNNVYGEQIKIVIGSQITGEGIDFKFIREIYVFDSWFHLSKLEQVIGRGIRYCSHSEIEDEKKRNCSTYLLVNSFEPDSIETIDLYSYRNAMLKASEVGRVTRVLKEYAIDCNLNHDAIHIQGLDEVPMIDSQGIPRPKVSRDDMPYTALCDWEKCDNYQCKPQVAVNETEASERTYNEYAARWRETKLLQRIRWLFQGKADESQQAFITVTDFIAAFKDISRKSLSLLLQTILKSGSFQMELFGKKGRIIYKNKYFLFQPFSLKDDSIPLALRIADFPIKRDSYVPEKIQIAQKSTVQIPAVATQQVRRNGVVQQPTAETPFMNFWNQVVAWANDIAGDGKQTALLAIEMEQEPKKKDDDNTKYIPEDLNKILDEFFGKDDKLVVRARQRLSRITWVWESMKRHPAWRADLAKILKEIVYDEFLSPLQQIELIEHWISTNELEQNKHIWVENYLVVDGISAFRFVDIKTGQLRFICKEGNAEKKECTELQAKTIANSVQNTLKEVKINKLMTGSRYGFLVPKTGSVIFKNGTPPDVGKEVDKGQECSNSSGVGDHIKKIIALGDVIAKLPERDNLDLDIENLAIRQGKGNTMTCGKRCFENANRACFVMDIILRWMDMRKLENKRWFYRSVSSYIGGQKGKGK